VSTSGDDFERLRATDMGNETRIFWSEIGVIGLVAFLALVYLILLAA
jgi:hypothetical protein